MKRTATLLLPIALILSSIFLSQTCLARSVPPEEREAVREEVDQRAVEIVSAMKQKYPHLEDELNASVGYFAGRLSSTQVVFVGGGIGLGVMLDSEAGNRTYTNIRRFDVGVGIGGGVYQLLLVFHERSVFEQFRSGRWQSVAGVDTVVGSLGGTAGATSTGTGFSAYVLSETGAEISATLRRARLSVNHDLTDSGVSDISLTAMRGMDWEGEQEEQAPRIWDHRLPFLAQKVIDKGYDLPLPYGVGITYANVEQEQLLTALEVGINGGEIVPFEFVSFENSFSESDSASVKLDTWLFPFMNVFAMIGRVDGQAPLDVLLDGDGMLDYLGTDCSGRPKPPTCNLLQGQTIVLPVTANFKGTTYGIGMVLAGGWKSYFVTLPFNWTYADLEASDTDGVNFTVTPRVGKLFNLRKAGNLAVFVGGNYFDSDLDISGEYQLGDLLDLDYRIEQTNKDKWNAVVGFNWDFNRRWSWSAEYNGFTGSRDTIISSVGFRW